MFINISNSDDTEKVRLRNLDYRTLVKGVPDYPEIIYEKVNKSQVGQGVDVSVPRGKSLLMNLKSGTLRAVDANQFVTVCKASITYAEVSCEDARKMGVVR